MRIMIVERNVKNDFGLDVIKLLKVRECFKSYRGLYWGREFIV